MTSPRPAPLPFRIMALAMAAAAVSMAGGCGLVFEDSGPPGAAAPDTPPPPGPPGGPLPAVDSSGGWARTGQGQGQGQGQEQGPGPMDPVRRAIESEAAGLPAGYGTLRQEELAIRLRRGELEAFVVPLHEGVIRTAAPDTWERLSALSLAHRRWFREQTGSDAPYRLFLVALYTESEPTTFQPGELTLVSGGIRLRHVSLRGLTPGWEFQRLEPGEAQMAVYAFPPEVVLSGDLEVEYQEVRSRDWARVLSRVEAEQARVRARR